MNIGGYIKSSLIDFPGTISCVVFTQGCNFHCPYCHNPDLVPMNRRKDELVSSESIFSFLERRKGLLDGVVVTGGEPTLQKGLIDFLRRVKAMGFRVKLDTNGSRPQVLRVLFAENLVDYVAMDVKTSPGLYAPVLWDRVGSEILRESIGIIMGSSIRYEFRTTCVKPFTDEQTIAEIVSYIEGAARYVLQPFKANRTLEPSFFNGENPAIEQITLQEFKRLADAFVRECVIR
ncbi:MAG: anaerobic ribonucleoside-triphosphate reductase activating protein [Desulfobacteraceae bacterium]|jgi:pyruvate formate lyase activating enzyme